MEFCQALIQTFFDKLGVPSLLAGYDANSVKPAEVWTNGAIWYDVRPTPLVWDYCFGVVCFVSKQTSLFNKGEIPLEIIAKEVQGRFPNRWEGDFRLDALGKRFWDATADNATGCQVKPDGMLCFTGTEPFVKWDQIFGRLWTEGQLVNDNYFCWAILIVILQTTGFESRQGRRWYLFCW
jgi:hypothetical protein